jgi:deoxyribodipyrimidine photolyase
MFNHHNPLINENDYNYYIRCVNRFRQLLRFEEHKLFVMLFPNLTTVDENHQNEIIYLNRILSSYTKNYTLLVIYHMKERGCNYHHFTHHDNIDFLELHTLSCTNGVGFMNNQDNIYLDNIIHTRYHFRMEK